VKLAQGLLEFSRRQPAELPPLRFDPETLRQTLLDLAPSSAPRPAGEAQARAVGAPSGVRVLVVEDEQLVRQLVVQSLEVAGHVVTATASPNAALELVRDGLELDLLLTDFVMPELYGDELVEKVRELRPGLPALVMSGYVNNPDLFPQRLAFLPKPFRPSELVAAVLRALAQS
jgi:CheY-like chemotaxis protein